MKHKRIYALLLAGILLFSLCACSNSDNSTVTDSPASETTDTEDEGAAETRIVTDALGREVEIPVEVKTIVPLGNTPRMVAYLGVADRVVGIGECETADSPIKAYAWVYQDLWADLPNVGTDALGETAYYPEAIIAANPDVILCTYTQDTVEDIAAQTGIPVIAVGQGTLFAEDYDEALRILGEVCGVSDRAEELISYIDNCLDDLTQRTADTDDAEKPTVLAAAATFSGSHGIEGVYSNYPVFSTIDANDVAVGISDKVGGVLIDKEKILEWNPDMIFLDASGVELVQADYAENPDFYAQLKAVETGNLYQWPNSTWHWTNVEIPLVTAYYTGKMLYPEAFADVDFEEKASEIFDLFLGVPDYLDVLEEAGVGYTTVTLGE
jgi:iron complex transport system substrate-binding protein